MMASDSVRLAAYIDGELDLAGELEIEQRLAADPGLRAQAQALRELRSVLREDADYHAVPAALGPRVAALTAALTGALTAASAAPSPATPPRRVRWSWQPLWTAPSALAALAVVVLAVTLVGPRLAAQDRLVEYVVASHVRSTLGEHLVDVVSSDRHTVKPWLAAKLDFSPPVHALPLPGSVLLGARVDYLDGRPVAALVYRQGAHVVNSFVWPGPAADRSPSFATQRGFQLAHWTQGGMTHWVISDLNREEFAALVQAQVVADSAP